MMITMFHSQPITTEQAVCQKLFCFCACACVCAVFVSKEEVWNQRTQAIDWIHCFTLTAWEFLKKRTKVTKNQRWSSLNKVYSLKYERFWTRGQFFPKWRKYIFFVQKVRNYDWSDIMLEEHRTWTHSHWGLIIHTRKPFFSRDHAFIHPQQERSTAITHVYTAAVRLGIKYLLLSATVTVFRHFKILLG